MIKYTILNNIHSLDGRNIKLKTGLLAKQSNGALIVSMGNTILLVTVIANREKKENIDLLPLVIEYRQNYSAVGKIPGGFIKREGRSSDDEILTMRVVDRVLRPLFPEKFFADIQITISLLSYEDVLPNGLVALAASAALSISDIPYYGPISEIRLVSLTSGKLIINPCFYDVLNSDIDIIIGGSKESIIMMEGEMKEVSEEKVLETIIYAHFAIKIQIDTQIRLVKRIKKNRIKRFYNHYFENEDFIKKDSLIQCISLNLKRKITRDLIFKLNYRIDGRKSTDIRLLYSIVDYLPSTHGSSLFIRGETQSLTSVTLGTSIDIQRLDSFTNEMEEKFYLHYKFPPFSTGEIKPIRGISRREVGHGNLAQSALKNIIFENTPYTIRVVSEILESNGSSSMATVCAASLALMDAGISIKNPVAGIAMGLILDKKKNKETILSDIIGDEDYIGDMDLKIAGSKSGITACQMDLKIEGISYNLLKKIFFQARRGRMYILDQMLRTISTHRVFLKQNTPKLGNLNISKEYIGDVIGSGGKIIQEIQKKTNTIISIKEKGEFGIVEIFGKENKKINQAFDCVKSITFIPELGGIYDARVKSIKEAGAFVEILPGKEYFLHISEINWEHLKKIEDVLKIGDYIKVKLMRIDNFNKKPVFSRKVLLFNLIIN